MDGVCTRPLVQLAERFKVPVPVKGATVMPTVVVSAELTVTVELPLPMRVGVGLSEL